MTLCLNCHERKAHCCQGNFGLRGLCVRCWKTPAVRALFPRKKAPPAPSEVACQHCHQRRIYGGSPARRLCKNCYDDRDLRAKYPLAAEPPKHTICRHCQKNAVNRPRGLCWSCYYTPGIKEQYVSTSKYCNRGVGAGNRGVDLPTVTTDSEPGSEEKIAILEARAKAGVSLFHPNDKRHVYRKPTRQPIYILDESCPLMPQYDSFLGRGNHKTSAFGEELGTKRKRRGPANGRKARAA